MAKRGQKRGGHVRIEGDWESAVAFALTRKRPPSGWPVEQKQTMKRKPKRRKRKREPDTSACWLRTRRLVHGLVVGEPPRPRCEGVQ